MLRVGLTGGLGSGKSTACAIFRELGACVSSSDEIGRSLMQPGLDLYNAIVEQFGEGILLRSGALDRSALARVAFHDGRAEELNALIHPEVIEQQGRWMREVEARDPYAVAIVESALIFETRHAGPTSWGARFDRIVLVTAPERLRIQRYLARVLGSTPEADPKAVEADAHRRMAAQWSDDRKMALSEFIIRNEGTVDQLRSAVERVYRELSRESKEQADRAAGAAPPREGRSQ